MSYKDEKLVNSIKNTYKQLDLEDAENLIEDLKDIYRKMTCIDNSLITDKIKHLAKIIFDNCPKCTAIPIAIETEDGSDLDRIVDIEDLLGARVSIDDNKLIIPYFDDDMTKHSYDLMINAYKEIVKILNLKPTHDTLDDYCEYFHMNLYAITKDYKILQFYDVND